MKKKGFTLIELLVVIAIIGILTGIVLVSLSGARAKARDAKRQADIRQISSAQELVMSDDNSYMAWEIASGTGCIISPNVSSSVNVYLNPFPQDPQYPARCYKGYNATSIPLNKYCVYAQLESGGYFVASHTGTGKKTTEPTDVDNCSPP